MRNRKMKIVFTIVLVLMCVFCVANSVFAEGEETKAESEETKVDNFKFDTWGNVKGNDKVDNATKSIMGTAIVVIRVVATAVSIIMLSYIGMKYMMAAPNEKADMKKGLVIYVVGAILVFGAGNIMAKMVEFAENL